MTAKSSEGVHTRMQALYPVCGLTVDIHLKKTATGLIKNATHGCILTSQTLHLQIDACQCVTEHARMCACVCVLSLG